MRAGAQRGVEGDRGDVLRSGDRLHHPRPGAARQVVEPGHQSATQAGPAPVVAHREQVQVGQPVGGHDAEQVADVRTAGAAGQDAEAAELVEPDRVVQRPGVGVPEPVVVGEQAGAHDGRRQFGEPDERDVVGRAHRRAVLMRGL